MRIVLTIVFLIGIGLVGATAFLAIDAYATEDRRTAFQSAIAAEAAEYEESTGRKRGALGRLAHAYTTLSNGIFKSAGLDLPSLLPAAPEEWQRREYTNADGLTITGTELEITPIATTSTNSILKRFHKAGKGKKLTARASYINGAQLIALHMTGDMKAIRRAEKGGVTAKAAKGEVFLHLDGVPVILKPQFEINHIHDTRNPVAFRHLTLSLDRQVEIEILTNADDAGLLAVLSNLDMDTLQSALPLKTASYIPNSGPVLPDMPAE